jgi:septal ring factor EnvC (AmiA/AmiB activator)
MRTRLIASCLRLALLTPLGLSAQTPATPAPAPADDAAKLAQTQQQSTELRTENADLQQRIEALERDNVTLTERAKEIEAKLAEVRAQLEATAPAEPAQDD